MAEKVSFYSNFSFKEECSEGCWTQNIERYVPVQYLRTYDIQQYFQIEDIVKIMLIIIIIIISIIIIIIVIIIVFLKNY